MTLPVINASASASYISAGSDADATVTSAITTVAGSTLYVWVIQDGARFSAGAVTDSKGNTWVKDAETFWATGAYPDGAYVQLWRCTGTNRGASHTFTTSSTNAYASLTVLDVSPQSGETLTVDIAWNTTTDSSTPYTIGGTTGQANVLVISHFAPETNSIASASASGFTGTSAATGSGIWTQFIASKAQSVAGAVSAAWTGTGIDYPTNPHFLGLISLYGSGGGPSGITADLAVTDAADTVASTAAVRISAALGVTDAADTLSATATARIEATLAVTDAADTLVASAAVRVSAGLSVTDAADTLASTATIGVSASLAVTDTADTLVSTAAVKVVVNLAVTDAADTLSSTVLVDDSPPVGITADLAVTDDPDTLASTAVLKVTASLAVTDAADTLTSTVTLYVVANLAVTDAADTLQATMITDVGPPPDPVFEFTTTLPLLPGIYTKLEVEVRGNVALLLPSAGGTIITTGE